MAVVVAGGGVAEGCGAEVDGAGAGAPVSETISEHVLLLMLSLLLLLLLEPPSTHLQTVCPSASVRCVSVREEGHSPVSMPSSTFC